MSGGCPFAGHVERAASSFDKLRRQPVSVLDDREPICPARFGARQAGTCPLGFGSNRTKTKTCGSLASLPKMTLAMLASHNGSNQARLISLKGIVFDVSVDDAFGTHGALKHLPGHDISRIVALLPDGEEANENNLDRGLDGLRYDEHRRLEVYFNEMSRTRAPLAVLAEEDYERIFGTPFRMNTQHTASCSSINETSMSKIASLHACAERNDPRALELLLNDYETEDERRQAIETPCARTGLTALLKAVEVGSVDMVKMLLHAGADKRSKAALYDGDDALALAKRLGSREDIIEQLNAICV